MERLRCQIRSREATDDSMLVLLAAESLRPLAETRGRSADYRDADMVALLQSAEVFIAECESNIAGYVAVTEDLPDLVIEMICVSPAYEARGVAHQLLDWVEGLAFNHHVARMTTLVAGDDQRALHFFEGRGFAPQPSEGGMVVLEKRLPDVTIGDR